MADTVRFSCGQAAVLFKRLSKNLREAGSEGQQLRRELRAQIAQAGKPVVEDVRAAVRELHVTSTHGGGTAQRRAYNVDRAKATAKRSLEQARLRAERRGSGLRETIARATNLSITTKGVRIVTRSSALPENQQSLPRHLDSDKGWRHPVFGNREVWVRQAGGPWFAETIKERAPAFRQACVDAIKETNARIERGIQ